MEWMNVAFAVSGVQTWLWLPPAVAFVISFFSSMVGISGALPIGRHSPSRASWQRPWC